MNWKPVEDVERDKEKAEEQSALYGGVLVKADNVVEIRTGVIIAARFADKIRRAAFAAFKHVPQDKVLKAIAELNKSIYEKMVGMGIGKLDVVRISVEAKIDGGELTFGEPQIERFIPHSKVAELENELKICKTYIKELKNALREILSF